jgi:formylglycine-generating enzyme required for sulfatase activity
MKRLVSVLFAGCSFSVLALQVSDVTARSRWPWENVVDVEFTVSGGGEGAAYLVSLDAQYDGGKKKLSASTYLTEPVAVTGFNRISWNVGADAKDVAASDLTVRVTVAPLADDTPVYCVIDLSGGSEAEKWPVRYTLKGPEHVKGATGEKCQTTEMWLRRIPARDRVFIMGYFTYRGDDINKREYYAKLTQDYYVAVFETTQQQYFQMTGSWPSAFSNELYRASRPADSLVINDLRSLSWPVDKNPGNNTLITRWREKTGLTTLDLPTEAQWEFCAQSDKNNGVTEFWRYGDIDKIARYSGNNGGFNQDFNCDLSMGTAAVGSYEPNKWGIYDLLGNVTEMVLDAMSSDSGEKSAKAYYIANGLGGTSVENPVVDPAGPPNTYAGVVAGNHVMRGGTYRLGPDYSTVFARNGQDWIRTHRDGFRLVFTVK